MNCTTTKIIEKCGISDSREFHVLWKLPQLPLTEKFGVYDPENSLAHDQELVISMPTGHVQLRRQIDPSVLYTNKNYAFRTAASAKSRCNVDAFLKFLAPYVAGRRFRSVVDVGGNDGYLAEKLVPSADAVAVVDPICTATHGKEVNGVLHLGMFVEEVDFARDLNRPDLVICRHTLEHVSSPDTVISRWFEQCSEECIYAIEIPCFESLLEGLRLDAVFHQHYHYYDLHSLKYLIWKCGGEYVSHFHYWQGSCGGSLFFLFRRASTCQIEPDCKLSRRIEGISKKIGAFELEMSLLAEQIKDLPKPAYGYGAGLMLSTYAYHLKSDLTGLECILDDDPLKHETGYENLRVTIKNPARINIPENASYVITSLENVRPIYRAPLKTTF